MENEYNLRDELNNLNDIIDRLTLHIGKLPMTTNQHIEDLIMIYRRMKWTVEQLDNHIESRME